MDTTVTITEGTYRGAEVHNETFVLVQDVKSGAKGHFITVRPNENIGGDRDKIRINVQPENVVYEEGFAPSAASKAVAKTVKPVETDEEVIARISDRFAILEEMTAAAIEGAVRAVIVSGPPGVGKSYGITRQLEKANLFNVVQSKPARYNIIKGAMTPIALYSTLFMYGEEGNVLVFDDCDSILMDDLALNILKAALDSGKKRRISWHADSKYLEKEGIPNSFDFKGSVIFVTNLKFNNVKSKKLQDHLEALQSRCHYLDLAMSSERDRMLRIKQVHKEGDLFLNHGLDEAQGNMVIDFMHENKAQLRELSLRMAVKIADLVSISPNNWQRLARSTVMKNSF